MFSHTKQNILMFFSLLSSLMLAIVGAVSLFRGSFETILLPWMGILVLISAAAQIITYFLLTKTVFNNRGFLIKGIITLFLGLMIILGEIITPAVPPMFVSMLLMLSGLLMLAEVISLLGSSVTMKWPLWLIAPLTTVIGFAGFISKSIIAIDAHVFVGISLILEALVQVYGWFFKYHHLKLQEPGRPQPVSKKHGKAKPEHVDAAEAKPDDAKAADPQPDEAVQDVTPEAPAPAAKPEAAPPLQDVLQKVLGDDEAESSAAVPQLQLDAAKGPAPAPKPTIPLHDDCH